MTAAFLAGFPLCVVFVGCSYMALRGQVLQSPSLGAWNLATAVACTALALLAVITDAGLFAVVTSALAVFRWWLWWRGPRNRRRRSLRALGHKARARLAAMLRSMPGPGPALRPVPQGASWG